jgi:hypothetical protein
MIVWGMSLHVLCICSYGVCVPCLGLQNVISVQCWVNAFSGGPKMAHVVSTIFFFHNF